VGLQDLTISDNGISALGISCIVQAAAAASAGKRGQMGGKMAGSTGPGLRLLDVSRNPCAGAVSAVGGLLSNQSVRLAHLSMCFCALKSGHLARLANALSGNTSLVSLQLEGNDFSPVDDLCGRGRPVETKGSGLEALSVLLEENTSLKSKMNPAPHDTLTH